MRIDLQAKKIRRFSRQSLDQARLLAAASAWGVNLNIWNDLSAIFIQNIDFKGNLQSGNVLKINLNIPNFIDRNSSIKGLSPLPMGETT
jgi:hypothetical protein